MFKNSKLSRYKAGKIIECFCIDIDATKTALLLKLNRKTVNRYFLAFRRLIYLHQVSQKEQILGVVEVDESFFGPARVRGRPGPRKRGRGTLKQPVFGIYERDGVDVGFDKHFRINKSKHFAEKSVHINGIEAFWSFTKRRLAKFNGVKRNFELHLKECEWRYNQTLPQLLASLKLLVSKNKDLMV